MDSAESQTLLYWQSLPRDLIGRVLEFLEPNERAINGRLVSRNACRRLSEPLLRTALFRLPLPQHAALAWHSHIHRSFQQLTFFGKFISLSAAAASGSQLNLELAWALLQPCVSLGLDGTPGAEDAGTAAVRHGHLHLLPRLLQHGCPMDKHSMLLAATELCDLAGMQRVWELLGFSSHHLPSGGSGWLHRCLAAAAGSSVCDAVTKLSWLLARYRSSPRGGVGEGTRAHARVEQQEKEEEMLAAAAEGAAASGSLPVLQWLLQTQGQPLLRSALGRSAAVSGMYGMYNVTWWTRVVAANGHVAVVDWLAREVDPPVRPAKPPERAHLWEAAAEGGNIQAMRWLLRYVVRARRGAMEAAAASGQLEAVRFLHEDCGLTLRTRAVFCAAAGSGSVLLATWLLQAGCPMSKGAYGSAARGGHGAMLTWLAKEARCPWGKDTLRDVLQGFWSGTRDSPFGGRSNKDPQLEQAVWAMLEAGCPPGGGTDRADSIGAAAKLGYLDLVRHLREDRGVAFARGTLAEAAWGGCVPVVEWLVGAGCRAGAGADNDPYLTAATASCAADVATLSCLRRLGVPWHPSVLRRAVDEGVSLRVLRWMVEQGAPWDEDVMLDVVVECLVDEGVQNDETAVW